MDKTLRVIVVGPHNSGKTTLAELLVELLDEKGIPAKLTGGEPNTNASYGRRLQALLDRCPDIEIRTIQTQREEES